MNRKRGQKAAPVLFQVVRVERNSNPWGVYAWKLQPEELWPAGLPEWAQHIAETKLNLRPSESRLPRRTGTNVHGPKNDCSQGGSRASIRDQSRAPRTHRDVQPPLGNFPRSHELREPSQPSVKVRVPVFSYRRTSASRSRCAAETQAASLTNPCAPTFQSAPEARRPCLSSS
jgi:hypothetical protein